MPVARHPPHRSRRALLTHRAPPSKVRRQSAFERYWVPMQLRSRGARDCRCRSTQFPGSVSGTCDRLTVALPFDRPPSLHRPPPPMLPRLCSKVSLVLCSPVRLLTRVHVRPGFALRNFPELAPDHNCGCGRRMRPPRFRTKDVSTCMRSPTAQGPIHTCQDHAWIDVAFSSTERDQHLGI